MPSPSSTEDHHEIKQVSSTTGFVEAMFIVKVDRDYDTVTLLNILGDRLIQNELTYDSASALYFSLGAALDTLEDNMLPTFDDEDNGGTPAIVQ